MNRFDDIRKWGMDRNIIQGTRPEKQFIKLMEEVGELAEGMKNADPAVVDDSIGDAIVVLVMLSAQNSVSIEECWNDACQRGIDRDAEKLTRHEQFEFLISSIGMLAEGLAKGKREKVMIGIGNSMATLSVMALDTGAGIHACMDIAWNEIKDRKGKMVDGIFIKEADLPKE